MAQIPNPFGDNDGKKAPNAGTPTALVSYVVPKIIYARQQRESDYGERWREYTRMWRGMWGPEDKNNNSERSRLIAPALQQAIEMTVAEMEEAVFSRTAWFDIEDDIRDENKDDAIAYRDQLLEDFELTAAGDGISAAFLLGAVYGTGIAKINVVKKEVIEESTGQALDRVVVQIEAIRPDEFIIDTAATNIAEAEFVAHEVIKPRAFIRQKQAAGVYRNTIPVESYNGTIKKDTTGTRLLGSVSAQDDGVLITEYFGKVPARFIKNPKRVKGGMVEAMITIANESYVLRAVESPFDKQDRPIVAYQHDTVPGEFWGRGVAEKGYNPQKALDAEVRARVDALGLILAPMMGVDMTRLPRNPDMRIRPGKMLLTRGRPSEVIEPVGFSAAGLAATFQQSGEFERMVQMGTGAMDSATPNNISRRNETVGGMGMMQSGFLKRSKRTMQNIERRFLDPIVKKSLWRYMQFDPARYPKDMTFVVNSTMGIMAKEVENQNLSAMLNVVGPESPAHNAIVSAILSNTNSSEKAEVKKAIEQMNQPPSEEDQQMAQLAKQIQIETAKEELNKLKLDNALTQAEIEKVKSETKFTNVKADLEDDKVQIDAANSAVNAENTRNRAREIDLKSREIAAKPSGNS